MSVLSGCFFFELGDPAVFVGDPCGVVGGSALWPWLVSGNSSSRNLALTEDTVQVPKPAEMVVFLFVALLASRFAAVYAEHVAAAVRLKHFPGDESGRHKFVLEFEGADSACPIWSGHWLPVFASLGNHCADDAADAAVKKTRRKRRAAAGIQWLW